MAAAATETATRSVITLKGSVEIVTEFFGFAINSILFQRGIYPPETFDKVAKYGLPMLVSTDEGLKSYLSHVLTQISGWLLEGKVQKLVVVITGADSGETLERWVFNISPDKAAVTGGKSSDKPLKEIQQEIAGIIRQITASVSFLPLLSEPCAFDLLVYTDPDAVVPRAWEDSDPRYIKDGEDMQLRSFTTRVHKVSAAVSYRRGDDEDI
ncbi:hypothetical protein FNF29_02748 [Cafeteria roenbergensis]|uniref:HORMA domain-containing protein n=1 Tax=Cafeteria roenbergensis TaxID=33653 RepID=A0A5A8CN19_CAFRO|nr:hypothetical protein FNF29_02748 [Cafeteria roenbergensis]|eukprot:KAA0154128.1 hypothetical protein FNF29_02748 [Cafeteria roenbergensis]